MESFPPPPTAFILIIELLMASEKRFMAACEQEDIAGVGRLYKQLADILSFVVIIIV